MTKKVQLTEQELLDNAVKKQYIWEKEIVKIDGNFVEFTDGTVSKYTEKQLSYLVTEEPKDATQIRDLLLKAITPELLDILDKHDVRKWDLQAIFDTLFGSYNQTWYVAIAKAFWTYREWVYPETLVEDIRISHIKDIIK